MTFRKFVAATTRDCLRMMREALGPDAMIVSTRRTSGGVEVVGTRGDPLPHDAIPAPQAPPVQAPPAVAPPSRGANLWDRMDDEPVRLSPAARVLAQQDTEEDYAPEAADLPLASWPRLPERQISHLVRSSRAEYASAGHAAAVSAADDAVKPKPVVRLNGGPAPQSESERLMRQSMGRYAPVEAPSPAPAVAAAAPATAKLDEQDRVALANEVSEPIMSEMRSMRGWLERQMDVLAWRDTTQRNPMRRVLWSKMVDSGFTPELARTVVTHLPEDLAGEEADQWLVNVLVRNLMTADPLLSMVEEGGRYAIVGPTGVGKTTTTAKIAAHCVVKYGAASLGLITTDQHRIGAVDQLHTFGQILGVEVYAARSAQDLEAILGGMADRRLVLVDTAGMSQRDDHMGQHLKALAVSGVKRVLVMPGATHAEQAEDIVQAYSADGLAGLIVSKLDEAVRLGGVLDASIRHRVPLQFVTNGQRVPDDLHAASAQLLVHRALRPRSSPVFALDATELDWACMPSSVQQAA